MPEHEVKIPTTALCIGFNLHQMLSHKPQLCIFIMEAPKPANQSQSKTT